MCCYLKNKKHLPKSFLPTSLTSKNQELRHEAELGSAMATWHLTKFTFVSSVVTIQGLLHGPTGDQWIPNLRSSQLAFLSLKKWVTGLTETFTSRRAPQLQIRGTMVGVRRLGTEERCLWQPWQQNSLDLAADFPNFKLKKKKTPWNA